MALGRRSFLKFLGGAAATVGAVAVAGADFDPERLLWVPGSRKIFLPSETILEPTPDLTDEVLRMHGKPELARYVLTVQDGQGQQTIVAYDAQWRPVSVRDAMGRTRSMRDAAPEDIHALQRRVWGDALDRQEVLRTVQVGNTPPARAGVVGTWPHLPGQKPVIAPRTSDAVILTDKP